jgi:nitrous oxidase accessory protein NosD
VAAAITRATSGQTIILRAGIYHESVTFPASKQLTVQAYPGDPVWFDGSVPVRSWERSGSAWVARRWTAQFDASASFSRGSDAGGFVNPARPMAAHPDQVFLDGNQLEQVPAETIPGPGQFAVDHAADTLTIGSNPTGRDVRASDLSQAIVAAGPTTLRGFGVRRYATSLPMMGTVFIGGRMQGSIIENLVISDNATQGLSVNAPGVTVTQVTSSRNGMTGLHANTADGIVVQDSLFEANNTQGFNAEPSAGSVKITRTRDVVVRANEIKANAGINGIWLDESVVEFEVTNNHVEISGGPYGVLAELSDTGIVAGNVISGAEYGYTAFNTGNVQVFNNEFRDNSVWDVGLSQDERREATSDGSNRDSRQPQPDPTCPWLTRNITVANNVFGNDSARQGGFQFYALDKRTNIDADAMNITIEGNVFAPRVAAGDPVLIGWGGSDNRTVAQYNDLQAFYTGEGKTGTNIVAPTPGPFAPGAFSGQTGSAVPLPADVARATGQSVGTRHFGTWR